MVYLDIFHDIFEAYRRNCYCDLEIMGLIPSRKQVKPILCHKLVVISFIPQWKDLITEDVDHISLPDFEHEDLLQFFNLIYESLLPGKSQRLKDLNTKILAFFGIKKSHLTLNPRPKPSDQDQVVIKTEPVSEIDAHLEDALSLFHDSGEESEEDPLESSSSMNTLASINEQMKQETQTVSSKTQTKKRKRIEAKVNPRKKSKHEGVLSDVEASKSKKNGLKGIQLVLRSNHDLMQSPVISKSIDLTTVQNLMTGKCKGQLNVDVTTPNIESKSRRGLIASFTERRDAFFALIGVQKLETELVGQSLAWTSDNPRVLDANFDIAIQAFQSVFGLARMPLLDSSSFFDHGKEISRHMKKKHSHDLFRKFTYEYSRQDLENELKKQEMVEGFEITSPTRKDLDLPLTSYTIRMTDNLATFDDVLLVGAYPHGVEIRKITLASVDFKANTEQMLARLLTMVWMGGNSKAKFKPTPYILEMCQTSTRLIYAKNKIERLLASDEVLPRPLPTVVCDICGHKFQENTCKTKMLMHRRLHDVAMFQCQCGIKFSSLNHKMRHYNEVHVDQVPIEEKKTEAIRKGRPLAKVGNFVCDTCGKVLKSSAYLQLHMKRYHGTIHCEHCNQELTSNESFKSHCEEAHPDVEVMLPHGWFTCHECDAAFSRKRDLTKHVNYVHGLKAHKCGLCEKSFPEKPKLKYHVLSAHVKSRPYVCRSEGCNSTFNYFGNLYAHEKKVHGRSFGQATPIDDMLTDEQLLDYGCDFEAGKSYRNRISMLPSFKID